MDSNKPGVLKRCWRKLKQPSAKYSLLSLLVIGLFAGIIFWGGFNTAMEATNTLAFCTSCHEMLMKSKFMRPGTNAGERSPSAPNSSSTCKGFMRAAKHSKPTVLCQHLRVLWESPRSPPSTTARLMLVACTPLLKIRLSPKASSSLPKSKPSGPKIRFKCGTRSPPMQRSVSFPR